jgi:hypothetical protein
VNDADYEEVYNGSHHTLYHCSSSNFKKFKPNAPLTFFFEDKAEAKALLRNVYEDFGKAYLYTIEVPDDVFGRFVEIEDEDVEADIVCNPSYEELRSGDIGAYVSKAKEDGAAGFEIADYSQIDSQNDATSYGIFPETLARLPIKSVEKFNPYK